MRLATVTVRCARFEDVDGERKVVEHGDLVGVAEAADILGVERGRISRWRARGATAHGKGAPALPDPIEKLKATEVWHREDIERLRDERKAWAEKRDAAAAAA